MCIIIAGSEHSLVEFGVSTPPHLLKVCSAQKDMVEMKCMGSVCGKTPTEPKLIYSSLTLGTSNHVTVDVMCIHSYTMGDKIRRMSINVAFEYICQKEWSCLTYGRIVYLYKMYQTLHNYDYHLPKIRYALF